MNIPALSTKDRGNLGERLVERYLRRLGFRILGRNIARKTGELDIVARKGECLHFVEVKALMCREFPGDTSDGYDPADNLHPYKIRKVARTAEWYVAEQEWEGEWQVDGALVWLRERDGKALIRYLPQIV